MLIQLDAHGLRTGGEHKFMNQMLKRYLPYLARSSKKTLEDIRTLPIFKDMRALLQITEQLYGQSINTEHPNIFFLMWHYTKDDDHSFPPKDATKVLDMSLDLIFHGRYFSLFRRLSSFLSQRSEDK